MLSEPLLPARIVSNERRAVVWTLTYLCVGVAYCVAWKHLDFTDSIYFVVSSLLSIGYGDISFDHDTFSYVFASVYLLVGLCLSAFVAGVVLRLSVDKWNVEVQRQVATSLMKERRISDNPSLAVALATLQSSFLKLFFAIISLISVVAYLIAWAEGWPLAEGFYWAVVSVSTVGYGDIHVNTILGKWIAIFFLPVGVLLTACFFTTLASIPFYIEKADEESSVLTEWGTALTVSSLEIIRKSGQIKQLGLSQDERYLTRSEYIIWLLLQLGKVDLRDIKRCGQAFDLVDLKNEQRLDLREFDPPSPKREIRRGLSVRELSFSERNKRG